MTAMLLLGRLGNSGSEVLDRSSRAVKGYDGPFASDLDDDPFAAREFIQQGVKNASVLRRSVA